MSESVTRARSLLQRGLAQEAYDLLVRSASLRDAQAAAFLGDLRLSGQLIRRDIAAARHWFGLAAGLGLAEVEPVFIALLANGAGGSGRKWQEALSRLQACTSDVWAQRQARLIADMTIDDDGEPLAMPRAEALSKSPRIEVIPYFFSEAECLYMIERTEKHMQPATVVDHRTGRLIRNSVRSAKSASFPFVMEDPAVHAINRRIAAATGTVYEQGEPAQVLRYDRGDEYKLHSDAMPGEGEQRVTTLLVALRSDFVGGETTFPHLGLTWRGETGDALVFHNLDHSGQPEPRMWHAGAPVTRGTKHLLSKWIRSAPLDLSGPPGRPL